MQGERLGDLLLEGVERIERGLRLLEHDGDVAAAHVAHLRFRQGQQVAALEQDLPRRMIGLGVRQQLHHRQRGDRFSGSRFADQCDRLAFPHVERHLVDRQDVLVALAERDRQFAHGEEELAHLSHHRVLRGSKASRIPSPMKISSDSMMATVKKPDRPSHGAWILAFPWLSISPSEGEPGGSPKPRKSSAVSVITDDDRMKGRNVMVATMALGSMWRNMITALETPSARAAWMYSKLRPRRNSARTRPTSDTQENSSRMPSKTKKPGTSTEEIISRR